MDTKNIVKVSEHRNAQMHQLHNSKCEKCCVKKGQELGKNRMNKLKSKAGCVINEKHILYLL